MLEFTIFDKYLSLNGLTTIFLILIVIHHIKQTVERFYCTKWKSIILIKFTILTIDSLARALCLMSPSTQWIYLNRANNMEKMCQRILNVPKYKLYNNYNIISYGRGLISENLRLCLKM